MELGQKLKAARSQATLSQQDVAEKIGVSRQSMSNWENSRSYPDIGSLIKLSDLYGLSLDEMLRESRAVRDHFDALARRRRKLCQILLEVGIFLQILGMLLTGQDFSIAGLLTTSVGAVLVYGGIIGHLRHFDHTPKEIRFGILGLCIQLGSLLCLLFFPSLSRDWLFRLIHLAGIVLLWLSGVWEMFWKSPRVWIYLALYLIVPLFSLATNMQDTGSFHEVNPFSHYYRVSRVAYAAGEDDVLNTRVQLGNIMGTEYFMCVSRDGGEFERIGEESCFSYLESVSGQTEQGIWILVPDTDPNSEYRVAVESDDSVTLSHAYRGDLQYKWVLSRVDTAGLSVTTWGKTTTMSPVWYPLIAPDPEPYLKTSDVVRSAKMNIAIEGLSTDTLLLKEEYHHGESVEYREYTLSANQNGSFSMDISTRYDGDEEYALYRVAYEGGEYRFILTYGA